MASNETASFYANAEGLFWGEQIPGYVRRSEPSLADSRSRPQVMEKTHGMAVSPTSGKPSHYPIN